MTPWYAHVGAAVHARVQGDQRRPGRGGGHSPLPRHPQPGLDHGQPGRDHRRGRAGLADGRRAAAPAGLRDRQRRRVRHRHRVRGAWPGTAARRRSGCSAGPRPSYTDFYTTIDDPWFPEEGKAVRKTADLAFGHGRRRPGRHRRGGPVRLLHRHHAPRPGGDGLLQARRGRRLLQGGPPAAGRVDAVQHRRRPAVQQPLRRPVRHAHHRGRPAAARRVRRPAGSRRRRSASRCHRAGPCTAWPAP